MKAAFHLSLSLIVCAAVAGSPPRHGKGWRGIVPLHSTRADVERLLGPQRDSCRCTYETPEGSVYVNYSKNRCEGYLPGWNVPSDTVLGFTVYQKEWRTVSDLGLDKSQYVVTYDDSLTAYYTDREAGVSYTVTQWEKVSSVSYLPSTGDAKLRCEGFPAYDAVVTRYQPYASFVKKTDVYMFARLDDFAFQLSEGGGWRGYIIVYAGKISKKDEAELTAEQARQYLITKRNIPPERVISLNGGFREEAEIDLCLIKENMPPPTPTPTLSSKAVRIIGKTKR
jgi:hypothetical protein